MSPIQAEIEQYAQQVVKESLRKWASKAEQWMEELRNWTVGNPTPKGVPYIWHLGLISVNGRGNWSARIRNCGQGTNKEKGLALDYTNEKNLVHEWLQCGKEFEEEFIKAVTVYEPSSIYTVGDIRQELKKASVSESGSEQVVNRIKKELNEVVCDHVVTNDLPLRMRLSSGVKTAEIVHAGREEVLGNYRIFEMALSSLEERS